MSYAEAQALLLLAGIVIGEAVLLLLVHQLHKWRFPAPLWDATDRAWENTLWAFVNTMLTITGWAALAVATVTCWFKGHKWFDRSEPTRFRGIAFTHRYEQCARCEVRRLAR